MYLIAGLGNPGDKYTLTRHNIGFLVIDFITKKLDCSPITNQNFKAIVLKERSNIFSKPQTYMNASGESILSIADYYNIENSKIIIIHDDLDLPFGTIKFKQGGGHGGHNGLRSIDTHIGNDYLRIRVGIGKPVQKNDVANYVLSNFSKEEQEQLEQVYKHCEKSIKALQELSLDEVKSQYTLKLSV
ncbi:MAG: aminoacyl-tRNA hydrolase [Campylobacterales bacterium]|nr:aminoacyl-tRNA hydrolase [Campylobacterales bacterium]